MKFLFSFLTLLSMLAQFQTKISILDRARLEIDNELKQMKDNFVGVSLKRYILHLSIQQVEKLIEEKIKDIEMREEQERIDMIYRKYLASRIKSSFSKDFLTMRY